MQTLTLLGWLTIGTLGLNVLGFITARAAAYLTKIDQDARESPPPPQATGALVQVEPPTPVVPAEETAGHWWTRLFTLKGMSGFLVGPVQIPILLINSSLLAATFETILARPGLVITVVNMFGWEREVTDFDLMGLLISLGQMIAASATHLDWQARERFRLVFGLAVSALVSLMAYEVGASVYRGWQVEGDLRNAGLSGLLAFGIAAIEALVGIWLIDHFLLPLLLAVLWSVATPCRALARGWAQRRAVRWAEVRPPRHHRPHPVVLTVVYPLAALDQALIAPLRRLDRAVGSILPGGKQHKGGPSDVTPYVVTSPEELRLPANGRNPARMQGDQGHHPQAADRLDDRA